MTGIAPAAPSELERLARLLPDDPTTVIIRSQVRRGRGEQWVAGDPAEPGAVAFDGDLSPGDFHCIGTAAGILELADAVEQWHSIAVAPRLASVLEPEPSRQHPALHAIEDVHHVLVRTQAGRWLQCST